MSDVKKQLKTYLEDLVAGIEQGHKIGGVTMQIVSESDLEKFVRVGAEGDATLLRILGYDDTSVDDHPMKKVLIGVKQYSPDYVLQHSQRNLAVLELKRPDEDLDKENWKWEVISYCRELNAPLGILFNGYAMRVFINTHEKQLAKHHNSYSAEPVATAEVDKMSVMVDLLSRFAEASLHANPYRLAKNLASERDKIIAGGKRRKDIRSILLRTLCSEPPVDIHTLLSALAPIDALWTNVEPKPLVDELMAAWNSAPITIAPNVKKGANPALRAAIQDVCALKGWDIIEKAQIKGLNYRLDGVEEKGYCKVEDGPNVPPNLCVQGKDTAGAMKVIAELEKLK